MGPSFTHETDPEPLKLYAVVRGDLPEGLRSAQMAHAVAGLVQNCPESTNRWQTPDNNYLIVLEVEDGQHLRDEMAVMLEHCITHYVWREPDLDNAVTAIACFPQREKNWVFADLPLAYKPKPRWWQIWRDR
jgi:hypothetical protein